MTRVGVWLLRAAWLVMPFAAGPALGQMVAEASTPLRTAVAIVAWGAWTLGAVGTLVPHPLGLTLLRVLAPITPAVALFALVGSKADVGWAVAALAVGCIVAFIIAAPVTVDAFVDGSSYGPERRYALRLPVAIAAGPLPLALVAASAGSVSGPLLLAGRQWIMGGAALVVGVPVAFVAWRSVHGLAQRFVVFVPAGIVVHDRAVLVDPLLFRTEAILRVSPATADSAARDLSGGAIGLVIELALRDTVGLGLRVGRAGSERVEAAAILIAPLRPGAVTNEAVERGLAVV